MSPTYVGVFSLAWHLFRPQAWSSISRAFTLLNAISWLIGIRDFHQEVCWLKYYLVLWSNTFPLYFWPLPLTYTLPPSHFLPDSSPMYSTFMHLIACFKNVVARIFRYWHRDLSGHLSYFSVLYPSGVPPLLAHCSLISSWLPGCFFPIGLSLPPWAPHMVFFALNLYFFLDPTQIFNWAKQRKQRSRFESCLCPMWLGINHLTFLSSVSSPIK